MQCEEEEEKPKKEAMECEEEKKLIALAEAGFRTGGLKETPRFDNEPDEKTAEEHQVQWTEEEEQEEDEESEGCVEDEIRHILGLTDPFSPTDLA